jgi:hypothetical protein
MAYRAAVFWGVGEDRVRPGHSDQAPPDQGLRYRQFGGWGGAESLNEKQPSTQ